MNTFEGTSPGWRMEGNAIEYWPDPEPPEGHENSLDEQDRQSDAATDTAENDTEDEE